jgi:small subunit ribosomal protein S7
MPRRREVPKRELLPDPVYNSPLVTKFINCMMLQGKKTVTEKTFYGAMESIRERTSDDPLKVFRRAVDNVKPAVEVKSRRVGGSNYQVPIEVRPERSTALALRWLIGFSRSRPENSMQERLANELMEASGSRGGAFKKKDDTHRMAEANKAFAHYRW